MTRTNPSLSSMAAFGRAGSVASFERSQPPRGWSRLQCVLWRLLLAFLLPCLLASASLAGTVSGTITNGTTGKPADGVDVILLQLQGTMQPVANTKTDAQGHYQLTSDILGTAPMLLRAVYRGVNYHQPVTVGTTKVDIEVYEPTDKSSAFTITAHAIILEPAGTDLEVDEQYNIENNTNPPMAYYRSGGSFLFNLPGGAKLGEVTAGISNGMPVLETPIDKGKGVEAVDYPFRPGDSEVRVSYHLPYPNGAATLHTSSPYDASDVAYFAAPSVHVSADGFTASGQQVQGFLAYVRKTVPANTELTASISGTAPPPSDNASSSSGENSQGSAADSQATSGGDSATPTASITTMPARLDSLKWPLVGGFAVIFVLGAIFIVRRPQPALAGAGEAAVLAAPAAVTVAAPRVAAPPQSVQELDKSVSNSLDELKDALFRLELRHQAGTISADDYARERQRIDQKLRDLVQG